MLKRLIVAIGWITLVVAGCAPRQNNETSVAAKERPSGVTFSLETPIEAIARDPRGAAVLNKDIPGLLTNPNYGAFKGMTLKQLALLSSGKLNTKTLAQTDRDLGQCRTVGVRESARIVKMKPKKGANHY